MSIDVLRKPKPMSFDLSDAHLWRITKHAIYALTCRRFLSYPWLCFAAQSVEVWQHVRKVRATEPYCTSWYLATWRRVSTVHHNTPLVLSQFNPPVSLRNVSWDPTKNRFSKWPCRWFFRLTSVLHLKFKQLQQTVHSTLLLGCFYLLYML